MLVITDKSNNVVGIYSSSSSSDTSLAQIYPNNPEMQTRYNEYIIPDDKDVLDNSQKYVVENGVCVLKQLTTDELLAKIREKRDSLLKQCDFTQLPDVPLTDAKKEEWKIYRQQLREFPKSCDVNNPIFPIQPI